MKRNLMQRHKAFYNFAVCLVLGWLDGLYRRTKLDENFCSRIRCVRKKVDSLRVLSSEFVFDKAPHAQCHASTIAETKEGLACAWFGGVKEGDDSVGYLVFVKTESDWKMVCLQSNSPTEFKRMPTQIESVIPAGIPFFFRCQTDNYCCSTKSVRTHVNGGEC